MSINRWFCLVFVSLALVGCGTTYTKATGAITTVNAMTATGDKVKGNWAVVIDDSISNAKRTNFKTSSHVCSAHTLNLDGSIAIRSSLQALSREMFEETTNVRAVPPSAQNYVLFRLDEFNPRVSCQIGPVEGTCTASTELAVSVTANMEGKRRSFSVSSQRSTDGSAGRMCDKALDVAEESVRKAAKDVAERVGERLSIILETNK